MQRFQVPQFITVEDKIIGGFLTAKQFVYIAAAAILIVVFFFNFTGFLALFLSFIVGAAAVSLAWGKISDIPIPTLVLHGVLYAVRPHVFVWKRSEGTKTTGATTQGEQENTIHTSPKLSSSKLSELSWALDTKTHDERKK